jgi:hypothetical protein
MRHAMHTAIRLDIFDLSALRQGFYNTLELFCVQSLLDTQYVGTSRHGANKDQRHTDVVREFIKVALLSRIERGVTKFDDHLGHLLGSRGVDMPHRIRGSWHVSTGTAKKGHECQ